MRDTLDIPTEWKCILSVPHLIKHASHSWCHIDLCHFWVNFIILRVELTRLYVFSCSILYFECPFNICFVWVFVMHIFVRMTIHILMSFFHVHLCTNYYPYYSCMGFRHAHLCTNDYTYSYGFSSCTFLYEWVQV